LDFSGTYILWGELPQASQAHSFVHNLGEQDERQTMQIMDDANNIQYVFSQNMTFILGIMCTFMSDTSYFQIITCTLSYNTTPIESVHTNQNKRRHSIWKQIFRKCLISSDLIYDKNALSFNGSNCCH